MKMAMERFKDLAGPNHFYDGDEILSKYSKDHSFVNPRKPLAVIKPKSTDKIKKIIDLANETLIPIIPTSSGFPKFHGDTIPAIPGVVVDLSNLDQVLRVDRRNRIAIIEPGVTFGNLRAVLENNGLIPYTPLLPRSTKSVLSSALEREPITVPKDHWEFNDPLAGGEVVIGDGHVQGFGDTGGRTKQEAEKGEAIPVIPVGPSNVGWLTMIQGSQGTMGIVSWGAVRCRIKPSIQKPFFVARHDLKDIIPFLQKLLKFRFCEELFILNGFGLANILSEDADEIKRLRAALPPWILFVNLAGRENYGEKEVEWKEDQVRAASVEEGLELRDAVAGFSALSLLGNLQKAPDKDRRLRFKNSCQVLPFSTTLDKTPELVAAAPRMSADYGYPSVDLSIYIQPTIQGCQCDGEILFPYDSGNAPEAEMVRNLFVTASSKMANLGAYYSRPYGMLADIVYKDAGVVDILRKMKTILDPNGILNSGKLCF